MKAPKRAIKKAHEDSEDLLNSLNELREWYEEEGRSDTLRFMKESTFLISAVLRKERSNTDRSDT